VELREFLATTLKSWVEKVGIFLTIIAFVEKIPKVREYLRGKPIIDRFVSLIWTIGIFCMIWGFYAAWLTQYQSAQAKQRQIDQLTQPNFELSHGSIMLSKLILTNKNASVDRYAGVLISEVVVNRGAPSIITGWKLLARLKDGQELQGKPFFPPGQYLTVPDPKGNEIRLSMSSCLFKRSTAAPIPTGGQADGWVWFSFPVEYYGPALDAAVLTLDIEDVSHKHYQDVIPITGTKATDVYLTPSMRQE
jgi:hypothetical protein